MNLENRIKAAINGLPLILSNHAVNWSLENFRRQGYQGDNGLEAWPPRRSKKDAGRALLVKTGRLRRSIQVIQVNGTWGFGSLGVPYAGIHNYGGVIRQAARSELFRRNRYKKGSKIGRFKKGTTRGRGYTFKERTINMPQRRFLGASAALRKELIDIAKEHLKSKL